MTTQDETGLREAAQAAVDAYFNPKGGVLNLVMPKLRAALAANPAPAPLDVERLAEAIDVADARVWDLGGSTKWAEAIAAEYARLGSAAEEEGT